MCQFFFGPYGSISRNWSIFSKINYTLRITKRRTAHFWEHHRILGELRKILNISSHFRGFDAWTNERHTFLWLFLKEHSQRWTLGEWDSTGRPGPGVVAPPEVGTLEHLSTRGDESNTHSLWVNKINSLPSYVGDSSSFGEPGTKIWLETFLKISLLAPREMETEWSGVTSTAE